MPRGDQMGRQWKIIQTLISSKTGKSVAELIDVLELKCHPRTVYRDLDALQNAGFPIYNEIENNKNLWMLLESAKEKMPIPMNITELMSLYLARDTLKVLKHTVFYDSLKSLFQKIKTSLPIELINYLEQIENNLHIGHRPYKKYGEFRDAINSINDAVTQQLHIDIRYYTISRQKETARRVAPYNIWLFDGSFYLIGFCKKRNEVRMFALDRIKSLEVSDEKFDKPADFNIEDFMSSSFGIFQGKPNKVKIHFSKEIAEYIKEKNWHSTQILHPQNDGSIIFEADVAGLDEIRFWVLSWGSKAKVISPKSLKNTIQEEIKKMSQNYSDIKDDDIYDESNQKICSIKRKTMQA